MEDSSNAAPENAELREAMIAMREERKEEAAIKEAEEEAKKAEKARVVQETLKRLRKPFDHMILKKAVGAEESEDARPEPSEAQLDCPFCGHKHEASGRGEAEVDPEMLKRMFMQMKFLSRAKREDG